MKPKPFCPAGYEPVNDWIHKETGRRGFSFERRAMPDDVYCDIFDDLANHLGNHDGEDGVPAVCNVNGKIKPVPVEKWRQDPAKRLAEISTGYIEFYHGLMIPTTPAKVFVRADLRLPPNPVVIDGKAVRVDDETPAPVTPKASMKDLIVAFLNAELIATRGKSTADLLTQPALLAKAQEAIPALAERPFLDVLRQEEYAGLRRQRGENAATIAKRK